MNGLDLKRHRWLLGVAGLVALMVIGYLSLPILADKLRERSRQAKTFHETTATVVRKEYVLFDDKNRSYISDLGDRIEMPPGTEQWRVYYEFDNFDQIDEPERSRLLQLEKKRVAEGRLRFRYKSKEWYDGIEIGDKLIVGYKPFSDGEIEVANVVETTR